MVANDIIAIVALTLFAATILVWSVILENPEWLLVAQ